VGKAQERGKIRKNKKKKEKREKGMSGKGGSIKCILYKN
jgi:hypothetical protein